MKTYSELILLPTLEERFRYLAQNARPTDETFGSNRYFNQQFYRSLEWQRAKRLAHIRDNGCELGLEDYPITGRVYVHHIEPITIDDIEYASDKLFDLENLICMSFKMHQAIHYGDEQFLEIYKWKERLPNDTSPWL